MMYIHVSAIVSLLCHKKPDAQNHAPRHNVYIILAVPGKEQSVLLKCGCTETTDSEEQLEEAKERKCNS